MPSFAQGQQPNAAKLKADARNLVGLIGGDKAKTQAYCQILDLIAQLNREKDSKKAKALSQKIDQLQKNSIPNFLLDRNLFIRWRSRPPSNAILGLDKATIPKSVFMRFLVFPRE